MSIDICKLMHIYIYTHTHTHPLRNIFLPVCLLATVPVFPSLSSVAVFSFCLCSVFASLSVSFCLSLSSSPQSLFVPFHNTKWTSVLTCSDWLFRAMKTGCDSKWTSVLTCSDWLFRAVKTGCDTK